MEPYVTLKTCSLLLPTNDKTIGIESSKLIGIGLMKCLFKFKI